MMTARQDGLPYSQVADELIRALPELTEEFERRREWWAPEEPSVYEMVEELLAPFISERRSQADGPALDGAFAFIERLSSSDDSKVLDLVRVGILEGMVRGEVKAFRPYMGQRTRRMRRDMDRGDRLLRRLVGHLP